VEACAVTCLYLAVPYAAYSDAGDYRFIAGGRSGGTTEDV
jgi:hypothetical protein